MDWFFSQKFSSPLEQEMLSAQHATEESVLLPEVGALTREQLTQVRELIESIPAPLRQSPASMLSFVYERLYWRGGTLRRLAEHWAQKNQEPWLRSLQPPQEYQVSDLLFSPDSRVLFVSRWKEPAILWRFPENTPYQSKMIESLITPGSGAFDGYHFSSDGRFLSASGADYAGMTDFNEYQFVYDFVSESVVSYSDRYRSYGAEPVEASFVNTPKPAQIFYKDEEKLVVISLPPHPNRFLLVAEKKKFTSAPLMVVSPDARWIAIGNHELRLYELCT